MKHKSNYKTVTNYYRLVTGGGAPQQIPAFCDVMLVGTCETAGEEAGFVSSRCGAPQLISEIT